MVQKITEGYVFDMPVSFALTASQATTTYSQGSFQPFGINGASYTSFPVPSGLSFSVINYKLLSALTSDLNLSYILNGVVQNSVSDANTFVLTLQNPSRLGSPITANAGDVIQYIAYPVATITTSASETVIYSVVVNPIK